MFAGARSTKEEPCCCPCGIATANPQHFTVASWRSWTKPPGSSPGAGNLTNAECAPHPAHIHQIPGRSKLKGRNHRFLSYSSPSRSPRPTPSGSAGPSRLIHRLRTFLRGVGYTAGNTVAATLRPVLGRSSMQLGMIGLGRMGANIAVSYTHLRAHETDSY